VPAPNLRPWQAGLAAVGGGVAVALALPPWGWWPLAVPGLVVLDALIAGQPRWARFWRGWWFGVGWLAPGMVWMVFLTAPGYPVAVATYATYLGLACAVVPAGRWRWVALPGAVIVADAVRFSFPFGGVPLASLAIGQAAGPLAPVARMGGALALGGVTVAVAMAVRAAWARDWGFAAPIGAAVAVVLVTAAWVAPRGHQVGTMRVALVQGGGPQGTHAVNDVPGAVYQRHLAASEQVPAGVDLVVWPENVIDISAPDTFATSTERAGVADLARRVGAPVAVGVTEDVLGEPGRFLNYQQVVNPDGSLGARYVKVRRVPFGEYLPLRWLIKHLPGADLVPHDAVSGKAPAVLDTPPIGRLGVIISWEVFFGGRARDGAGHGGLVVLNPTNGSSYRGTILQTQQVASSRLRAIETGRWVAQVAPTGFTAVVTSQGGVVVRSAVSERRVIVETVGLRAGTTWYVRVGDKPVVALGLVLIAVARALDRRRLTARSTP